MSRATLYTLMRRIAYALLVVIGASVIVFIVTHLTGDPARLMLPLDATPEQYAALRKQLGTDQPLAVQLLHYFQDVLRGDFGQSTWQREPALRTAISHVPATVVLASAAIALSTVLGVPLGFLAAIKMDTLVDRVVSGL